MTVRHVAECGHCGTKYTELWYSNHPDGRGGRIYHPEPSCNACGAGKESLILLEDGE